MKRVRREFGAPYKFKDRNVADAKDGCIDCTSFDDRTFDLKKIELDKSIQVTVCLYSGTLKHRFVCLHSGIQTHSFV